MIGQKIGVYVGSKVPDILKHSIEKAVNAGTYLNTSDFIRDAIKEKLEREGFWSKAEIIQDQEI